MGDGNESSKALARSRSDRMLGGVCQGLAEYFHTDVTLIRLLWVVLAVITGGAGILAYLVAWAIIPAESKQSPAQERQQEHVIGQHEDSRSG